MIKQFDFMFSVICVQESWLEEDSDTSQIQLEGYKCILQGRSSSTKADLLFIFMKTLNMILNLS